jgi:hypothetical protein
MIDRLIGNLNKEDMVIIFNLIQSRIDKLLEIERIFPYESPQAQELQASELIILKQKILKLFRENDI